MTEIRIYKPCSFKTSHVEKQNNECIKTHFLLISSFFFDGPLISSFSDAMPSDLNKSDKSKIMCSSLYGHKIQIDQINTDCVK